MTELKKTYLHCCVACQCVQRLHERHQQVGELEAFPPCTCVHPAVRVCVRWRSVRLFGNVAGYGYGYNCTRQHGDDEPGSERLCYVRPATTQRARVKWRAWSRWCVSDVVCASPVGVIAFLTLGTRADRASRRRGASCSRAPMGHGIRSVNLTQNYYFLCGSFRLFDPMRKTRSFKSNNLTLRCLNVFFSSYEITRRKHTCFVL